MEFARAIHISSFFFLFVLAVCSSAAAQTALQPDLRFDRPAGIVHQYPLTGAREVPTGTDIGIRAVGAYDPASLAKQKYIAVGSRSGVHPLSVHLSRDRTMAIFHASTPFANGEQVRFIMSATLIGGMAIADSVRFTTMIRPAPPIPDWVRNEVQPKGIVHAMNVQDDSLPYMTVARDDSAAPGTIYFDNFGFESIPNSCFNFNADEHGVITRAEELVGESSRDFKPQPNGISTYYDVNVGSFVGVDSAWNVIDTFAAKNYGTDEHELRVFPDGSYALLGITISFVDLSQVVPDGADSAEVLGDIIQTFDPDGNLIFEWRGIDHYNVVDSKYQNLNSYAIDFEHANSLDFDSSGNILLSNRHLCEISDINGVTGDFIWRLGGAHNQFKLMDDSICFSFQHDARWIPGGHLTFFDNSNYDTLLGGNGAWIQQSRALEYALDTTAKTATLVWQYHHTPETWSDAMGSVERLLNGNTFIGWGDDTSVSMTEVRPDRSTAFEMTMHDGNVSYRAYKDEGFGVGVKDTFGSRVASASAGVGTTLNIETAPNGTISALFSLERSQPVTLAMYDMAGRVVRTVIASELESAGDHTNDLDLSGMPNGAYECVLATENGTMVRGFAVFK